MAETVVGIFDDSFEQLFLGATIMSAEINDTSKLMTHPLEDGSSVSDHQVFNLKSIKIPLIISSDDFVTVFQDIDKAYKKNTLFTIQTKVNIYKNMVIESKPHSESVLGGVRMVLSFTEFRTAGTAVKIKPKYPKDGDTKKSGNQSGTDATPKRETVLRSFYS